MPVMGVMGLCKLPHELCTWKVYILPSHPSHITQKPQKQANLAEQEHTTMTPSSDRPTKPELKKFWSVFEAKQRQSNRPAASGLEQDELPFDDHDTDESGEK